ncbi:MAG TPA: 50S ribosomal protein L23 [Proteobacteria bacterium]|nr:50S ribosomal protein L23 [bacterium BMS3Abin14]HDL54280.1 50S ribosomal protein L23 [Pseudomonadota bacterium]
MKLYTKIILRPLLTEKNTAMKEKENRVVFEVARDANKLEIKGAVEEAFKVSVEAVNILNVKGKVKRLGRNMGKRRSWKKAVVTLKEGSVIEFFEGV